MTGSKVDLRGSVRRITWWQWVIIILAVVGVVVGLQRYLTARHEPTAMSAVHYEGQVGVPGQIRTASLRKQPVPGWHLGLRELFPDVSRPAVEHVGDHGDHAFFTVTYNVRGSGEPKAWLVGVDVTNGTTLFAPVEITRPVVVKCLLNGPSRILCLNESTGPGPGPAAVEAWIVDTDAGTVLSHGPSKLRTVAANPDDIAVRQVGQYAVARDAGGWRGIDDQAQLTWTVKAANDLLKTLEHRAGDPYTDLAVASVEDGKSVVFSAVDGAVRKESGGTLTVTVGGFAEQESSDSSEFRVYDAAGAETGEYTDDHRGATLLEGSQLPVLSLAGTDQLLVLDPHGTPMAVLPSHSAWFVRFVGETGFTRAAFADLDDAKAVWESYSLHSGDKTSSCTGIPVGDDAFVGSDGAVVLGRSGKGAPLAAVDATTCEVLWKVESPSPVWQVGATLVQVDRGTYELVSLVPPAP